MNARPFRLVAQEPPEDAMQAAVFDAFDVLLLPPAFAWAMPIGHIKLTPAQAARLKRIGTKPGLPDIMVAYGGSVFGIELKKPGERLSRTRRYRTKRGTLMEVPGQVETFPKLTAAGMRLAVCRNVDEVLDALAGWRVPLRAHRVAA